MYDQTEAAERHTWLGVTYRTIVGGPGAPVSVTECEMPPLSGPPRHVHHAEDETFVVLSGAVEIWDEGVTRLLKAGEAATVMRGREHTYRVPADGPARTLVILTPGGFEGFFSDMARGQFRIPEDVAAIEESAARHNLSFTGPPL
ncbi:cupin domain-containing protein [Oceaniglobus roseus]|uniref:cupin domain-containing protein n=1 Tax=Oceaniglobus roseus TaxID=1737570 RepID=UPI001FE7D8F1|nr:cupin domain-containing protein [Kandeliimicrobium roseum]